MALDSMEKIIYVAGIASEYLTIKGEVTTVKNDMTKLIAAGTAFNTRIQADPELNATQKSEMQAALATLKADLVAHANAL
jgi:hypothetical protein